MKKNRGTQALPSLETGETAVVADIVGEPDFISRISATGFTRNAEITMVQNRRRGPLIVFVRDTQMALGRIEAGRITVRRKSK